MKVLAKNRRAYYDYDIHAKFWAGIVLSGSEVKSIKTGQASLKGSFVQIINGELMLINAHVNTYRYADLPPGTETRTRKLLAHKKEIAKLVVQKHSGMHLVPLALGMERGFVKVQIGIGKSQKKHDKRERIKKREAEKDAKNLG
jgi:SsrA-binding protein